MSDAIRKIASDLDKAIENKNRDLISLFFTDDCEIELLGLKLNGKDGVEKWMNWIYEHLAEVKFLPIVIMVEGNFFFEEFIVKAKLHNGVEIESKQAEVLIFENDKVKSLRLYFNPIEFALYTEKGFFARMMIQKFTKRSLKRLI